MSDFFKKISDRIAAAKGVSVNGNETMTGEKPNSIIINPDVIVRNESVNHNHERHHVLFWGRANPPTAGHEQAYETVKREMRGTGGTGSMGFSATQDHKKNPLTPEQKARHVQRAFPDVNTFVATPSHPTIMHQLAKLHENGVTHLHLVAGSDQLDNYKNLIDQYNGKHSSHGYFNFKNVRYVSAGQRDPDAEGTEGVSATKQRLHAQNGDYESFAKGAPSHMKPEHVKELYDDVRAGMTPPPKKARAKKVVEFVLRHARNL
jgi:hypothetical protein